MVVQSLMADLGMSERRACKADGLARSTFRYPPVLPDDCGVINIIQNHLATYLRPGLDLLQAMARHQIQLCGKTVLGREYSELRLHLPRREQLLPVRI